jgi:hypothetical protein
MYNQKRMNMRNFSKREERTISALIKYGKTRQAAEEIIIEIREQDIIDKNLRRASGLPARPPNIKGLCGEPEIHILNEYRPVRTPHKSYPYGWCESELGLETIIWINIDRTKDEIWMLTEIITHEFLHYLLAAFIDIDETTNNPINARNKLDYRKLSWWI